jgi:hypothetical protein
VIVTPDRAFMTLPSVTTTPSEQVVASTRSILGNDKLDAGQVIEVMLRAAKPDSSGATAGTHVLMAKLVDSGAAPRDATFKLRTSRTADGRRQLDIEVQ